MKLYVGLDVSLETTSVCVVDEEGRIRLEAQCLSEPAALIPVLEKVGGEFVRIGLEAGPLSQWLYFGLVEAGLPAVCIETRHAKAAIGAMTTNKNDRNDARSIAQVIRSGWFKTVHVKSSRARSFGRCWSAASSWSTKSAIMRMISGAACARTG